MLKCHTDYYWFHFLGMFLSTCICNDNQCDVLFVSLINHRIDLNVFLQKHWAMFYNEHSGGDTFQLEWLI